MIKHRVERALTWGAVTRFTRARVSGKRLILAYHGIIPAGERGAAPGERALFVTQERFGEQLDMLREVADVAPLAELDGAGDGRPRIAITFDDAYRGAVTAGVKELRARALPATIFVAPGRLDGHVFWWDALAHTRDALDPAVRSHALDALSGIDERVRAWAAESGVASRDDVPAYARAASVAELAAAADTPGITLGSHTWSHPNLARLADPALAAELTRPRDWLREHFGDRVLDWIAYPYGLDSPDVHRAAKNAGYSAALRITGGWHAAHEVAPHARPRLNVGAGMSVAGLQARVLGSIRA